MPYEAFAWGFLAGQAPLAIGNSSESRGNEQLTAGGERI